MTRRKGDFIDVPEMRCKFCGGVIASMYFHKTGKRKGMSRGPKRPGPMTGTRNRSDNRPDNLELWSSRHGQGQRVADQEPHWLPIYGAAMTLF